MATRRQTFRLYPSKAQEKALLGARRLHCYLYNACISHRKAEYKLHRLPTWNSKTYYLSSNRYGWNMPN